MSIRALMVVHIYGRRVDMSKVHELAKKYNLLVIEDLAEAHGVCPHPATDAACHSFYRNKIVAGEEGGAVWFRDPKQAALARQLRSLGFTEAHDFMHVPRGHNYRMSNCHAEKVLESLWEYDGASVSRIKQRREIEKWYDAACPAEWRMPSRNAPWVYDLRIRGMSAEKQNAIVRELNAEGIAARHAFKPMHVQPEYLGYRFVTDERHFPVSSTASQEVIYLPIQPVRTTEGQVKLAFDILHRAFS